MTAPTWQAECTGWYLGSKALFVELWGIVGPMSPVGKSTLRADVIDVDPPMPRWLMGFTPVVGTLAYLWDGASDKVLIIRRDARLDDDHFGKVNGLGGKVEIDEDVVSSARREIFEESNLDATALQLRGTVTFSDFGPKREQWLVFIFLVTEWAGQCATSNDEGSLEWVDRWRLLDAGAGGAAAAQLPMWPGDTHFLPLVFDGDSLSFHGTMPYNANVPLRWSHVRL